MELIKEPICSVREVHKSLNAVCLHFYEITHTYIHQHIHADTQNMLIESRTMIAGIEVGGAGEELSWKRHKKIFEGNRNSLQPDFSNVYTGVDIYSNISNSKPKCLLFIIGKLYGHTFLIK